MKIEARKLLLLVTLIFHGCTNETGKIPSKGELSTWYPEYYFESIPQKGIYVDHDTDSMIFRYLISSENKLKLMENIKENAKLNNWKTISKSSGRKNISLYFRRVDDVKHRYKKWHSLELLQVTFCRNMIYFGGTQFDIKNTSDLEASSSNLDWSGIKVFNILSNHIEKKCQ